MSCFGVLIILFVIMAIVKNANGGQNKEKKPQSQTYQRKAQTYQKKVQTYQKKAQTYQGNPQTYQNNSQTYRSNPSTWEAQKPPAKKAAKNKASKRVPDHRNTYESSSSNEIFEKASRNVVEQELAEQRELELQPQENVLKEVEDIMVRGYDGSLTFERDFVAEGIEMLNRIQM